MLFRGLADLVLIVHLTFVIFVVLGGLLALWAPRIAWVHIPVALYGATIEFLGFICPLTPLEIWLRTRGGEAGYDSDFIEHYVTAALYPSGLTRELQLVHRRRRSGHQRRDLRRVVATTQAPRPRSRLGKSLGRIPLHVFRKVPALRFIARKTTLRGSSRASPAIERLTRPGTYTGTPAITAS